MLIFHFFFLFRHTHSKKALKKRCTIWLHVGSRIGHFTYVSELIELELLGAADIPGWYFPYVVYVYPFFSYQARIGFVQW